MPKEQSNTMFPEQQRRHLKSRVVILVACPLDESINSLLSEIGAQIQRKTLPLNLWDTKSPPRIFDNLCFARHFAICMVEEGLWKNETMPFKSRLRHGSFWDHQGSRGILKKPKKGCKGAGESWSDSDIEAIEAVEILGTSVLSDKEILEEIFATLLENWVYLPIWWNCQDFAIRLGYLLTVGNSYHNLNKLLVRLRLQMTAEVIERRRRLLLRSRYRFAEVTSLAFRTMITGSVVPLVVPASCFFLGGILGAMGAMGSVILDGLYKHIDWQRYKKWKESMRLLENKYPGLRQLHNDVEQTLHHLDFYFLSR